MTSATYRPAPRARTTVPLLSTTRKMAVSLSFDAELVLCYSEEYLRRAGRLSIGASAIVRRALAVYGDHLATAKPAEEFHAVRSESTVLPTREEVRVLAELRLLSVQADEPLPDLRVIRVGPAAIKAAAEFEKKVDRLVRGAARADPRRERKVTTRSTVKASL